MHEGQITGPIAGSRSPSSSSSRQALASLDNVRQILMQTRKNQRRLALSIEAYTCTDSDLLLLKATTHSVLASLEQCFAILQKIYRQKP